MNTVTRSAFCLAFAAIVIGLATLSTSNARAADEAVDNTPHKVGLIDMAYVFKSYKKFEVLREELKGEIAGSEEKAKDMANQINTLQGKMKAFNEGSPEFTAAEKQLATLSAEFEAFRRAAQRDFLKKESQIYHTVYMETSDAVTKYCKHFNYTLVMRFSREDLDRENPQNLIQGMNRQVVYYRPSDDITDQVLTFLNQRYAKTSDSAGGKPTAAKPKTQPN